MNEHPHWYQVSETTRNWAITLGGLVIFLWYGCDLNSARLLREEVDARVKKQTEPLRVKLTKLDTELRAAQIAKESAEGQIATLTAARQSTPLIRLRPVVTPTSSYKGVREFSLDAQVLNDGQTPLRLSDIVLSVAQGRGSDDAIDKIFRTQRLWELEALLPTKAPSNGENETSPARVEFDQLHRECPHGQLLALDGASKDVQWQDVERLSTTRKVNTELLPGNSMSDVFAFVLTEDVHHNFAWYRFQLTINLVDHPSQTFTFFVPTGRESEPIRRYEPTSVTYRQSPPDQTVNRVWTTQSPLVPVQSGDSP